MKDGGSAFPVIFEAKSDETEGVRYYDLRGETGMSLRDYFAAQAMQGIVSSPMYLSQNRSVFDRSYVAEQAYQVADAMMKARLKEKLP